MIIFRGMKFYNRKSYYHLHEFNKIHFLILILLVFNIGLLAQRVAHHKIIMINPNISNIGIIKYSHYTINPNLLLFLLTTLC